MLRGKRIVLRGMERDDLKRWHTLMNTVDLVLLGNTTWEPTSLAQREHRFNQRLENKDRTWFVIEVDGTIIGEAGLHHWSWNRRTGVSELGVGIYDHDYLGKGYGPEAVALLLEWAFTVQNFRRIYLTTTSDNERALRAYRRLGFVEEGRLRQHGYSQGRYVDDVIMGLLRSEWDARQEHKG